jgi:hypothetical protein
MTGVGTIAHVEYEDELYAERLRREAQAAALASGAVQWTKNLTSPIRAKLHLAWLDVTEPLNGSLTSRLVQTIQKRTLWSLAEAVGPDSMRDASRFETGPMLLSLIEAEHEALAALAVEMGATEDSATSTMRAIALAPGRFRDEINRIFEAHLVAFHLHHNSRLVPIESHEMHASVVAPTLYLLHSETRFAAAESAYQKALDELRRRDPGDAITDAGTALQEALAALGCTGNTIGERLRSARQNGLIRGKDIPLTETIGRAVEWVSDKRNEGEAHRGDPEINMSDAWAVVHVVGALVIRLSEAGSRGQ